MTTPPEGTQDAPEEQLTAEDRASVAAAAAVYGVRPIPGSDVEAVGWFIAADRAHRDAQQRVTRHSDGLAHLYGPVRAADQEADRARNLLLDVEAAEVAAEEWNEALQQQRDAAVAIGRDRQAAAGYGPKAAAARARLETSGSTRSIHAERVDQAQERAREAAERIGTMDPARWAQLREEASSTLESYAERRDRLVAERTADAPDRRRALEVAQAQERAALEERKEAAAELSRRGLDAERVSEAARRPIGGAADYPSAHEPTERAIEEWQHQQDQGQQRDVDADLWDRPQPEQQGHQLDR